MEERYGMRKGIFCFLTVFFFSLLFLFSFAAHADPFPEPDPPVVHFKPEGFIQKEEDQSFQVKALPSVEWTYHKTPDHAHPDGNEQQMIWLMNRARSDPAAEGQWLASTDIPDIARPRDFFSVNTAMLRSEFNGYAAKPPAAFDVRLYEAARVHSEDMIARDAQDHEGQFQRIKDAGFSYFSARGSVFSFVESALHAHGGFNIDWGPGDGNMQTGRGHRMAIMSADGNYTNVGIAVVRESDPSTHVGPLVVAGNYCLANTGRPDHHNRFIVGTVWEDTNENAVYDPGEGKGGVTVMPDSGPYYAVTSDSGGYAVPVASAGAYRVSFTGSSLDKEYSKAVVVGEESVLLDLVVDPLPDLLTTSIPLTEGWNLISLPLSPISSAVADVLTSISTAYSVVWGYEDGRWVMYDPLNSMLNDLDTLKAGYGYWIKMTRRADLSVRGTTPSSSVLLKTGWNLVGYNASQPASPDNALRSVSSSLETVWGYRQGRWHMYTPGNSSFNDLESMTPGAGYWVKADGLCTWIWP